MLSRNRRHFLMGTLGASGASLLSRGALGQSPNGNINAAMIGTGNRGSYVLKGVVEQPGVKVSAVCDIKPDRLDKAASIAGRDNPRTYRDYRDLLANKEIDAVFIATPCDLHVEMAIAALKAGKHVYCEKPAGITAESIAELVRVAKASKTVFQVGQQMRSMARLRRTIDRIREEDVLGRIIMVKAQRHAGDDLAHDGPSADWFFDRNRSGDVLVEMSVHNLDLCNWVIASWPERACGVGGNLLWVDDPPGRNTMDGYSLSYDYMNGVKLSYTQVFFHPNSLPNGGQYTHVFGIKGAVDLTRSTFHPRGSGAKPSVLVEEMAEDPNAHTAAFFESIRTGKKPPAGIEAGASAALTAIMGREAIYQRRVTTWNEMAVKM